MKTKLKGRSFDTVEEIQVEFKKERPPGCILKVAEKLGSVCVRPRGLLSR
jgi:hypothetical protein